MNDNQVQPAQDVEETQKQVAVQPQAQVDVKTPEAEFAGKVQELADHADAQSGHEQDHWAQWRNHLTALVDWVKSHA